MKSNAAKSTATTQRKSASSSTRSRRPTSVPKSNLPSHDEPNSAELDGIIDRIEVTALEGEAGDRILEATGIDSGESGNALLESELKSVSQDAFEKEKSATKSAAAKPAISQSPSAMVFSQNIQAVTLHQPWASLIANGSKQYETRNWSTNHRGVIAIHAGKKQDGSNSKLLQLAGVNDISELPAGAVIAIAELTDCILMTEEFIAAQSETERACGDWTRGRYAWKLENVRAIEPVAIAGKQGLWIYAHSKSVSQDAFEEEKSAGAVDAFGNEKNDRPDDADIGEVQHVAEADGQLNLLEWDSNEPPDPDDFLGDLEAFKTAYSAWVDTQEEDSQKKGYGGNIPVSTGSCLGNEHSQECGGKSNQEGDKSSGDLLGVCVDSSRTVESQQTLGGSISKCEFLQDAAELAQDLNLQASNLEDLNSANSLNGTNTVSQSSVLDIPTCQFTGISEALKESQDNTTSAAFPHPANPSVKMESDLQPTTIETVSLPSSPQSTNSSPSLSLLKTLPDFSTVQSDQEVSDYISLESSESFPKAGTMSNGRLSKAQTLERPGIEKDCLLLRSPAAMSGDKNKRPPGQTKLDNQLKKLGLIQDGEVVNPEFLEAGYQLPIGWTNPEETRTAIELSQVPAQQLQIAHSLELPAEMESTAIEESPSEMPLTGELQPLPSEELNTSPALENLGSFSKNQLIDFAVCAHSSIVLIEHKEVELAMKKLDQARIAGACLTEYKKRCNYGEFEQSLNSAKINERTAQTYMSIAKNWELLAKASRETLLQESTVLGINWARDTISSAKKALKSAAPPADPDCWRTPNTKEQPIVRLVTEALGGEIWCDPCADAGHRVPAQVHYNKNHDGLKAINIWRKTVFINPPFSDPLPWVDKCCFSIARGDCSQAIMLLKDGTLSNQGTGELINKYASGICHWRGRINFLNDNEIAVKGSNFDCVLVYFGDKFDRFQETFETFGTVSFIENHYSSVNKRQIPTAKSVEVSQIVDAPKSIVEESRQLAAAVGLSNGKSVLPDVSLSDRALMERCDPHTVDDRPFAVPVVVDVIDETWCKETTIGVISNSNEFSDEQAAKMISRLLKDNFEERAKLVLDYLSDTKLKELLELCDRELDNRIKF